MHISVWLAAYVVMMMLSC